MNKAYNVSLLEIGQQVADEMSISGIVHKGVYTCLGGPNFETVAELKMLRMIGVDAVGWYTLYTKYRFFIDSVNKLSYCLTLIVNDLTVIPGMSTVHEVITARHCDLTVFAFSLITNQCITDYENHEEANHEEVMDVGKSRQPLLQEYVLRMVMRLRDMLGLETK